MTNRILFLIPLILYFLTSCNDGLKGEGDAGLAQDFKVEPFTDIVADGSFKLILIPNDSTYVSVQTHKNLIENMKIYVQNHSLNISEKESINSFESYVVYLYYNQSLEEISLNGKVLLENSSTLNFDNLELKMHDASIIKQFPLSAKEMEITIDGKAEITLSGSASTLKVKAKEYAKVNLEDFPVKVLEVDLAGEAEVIANIEKELDGRVLENSTLRYTGSAVKDVDVKDSGEIIKE